MAATRPAGRHQVTRNHLPGKRLLQCAAALVALLGQPPKCMPSILWHKCSCILVLFLMTHCIIACRGIVKHAPALVALLMQAPRFAPSTLYHTLLCILT